MSAYTENIHIEWVGFWKIGNKARQGKCNGMIVGKVGHFSRSTNCHHTHSKIYWTLRYWRYVLGCFDKWLKWLEDWESTVGDEFPFICSSHVASLPCMESAWRGLNGPWFWSWTLQTEKLKTNKVFQSHHMAALSYKGGWGRSREGA